MLANVRIDTLQRVTVARLSGEIDASNASDLGQRLTAAVPNSAMGMVVDLTETSYLDSSGVQLLFELADRLRRRQQRLQVVVPPESFIADLLRVVSLGGMAEIGGSLTEAIAALNADERGGDGPPAAAG